LKAQNALSLILLQGGDLGNLKMTMPIAFTTSMLAWGMLAFPDGYAEAGTTKGVLEQVQWSCHVILYTLCALCSQCTILS
jgi:endoglucanase